ncbi:MAG: TonB-dependent receptor [Bacteroidetes bacterium]|nr:TonB-dependent receptor [Bacteroidota bacterium]
MAKYLITIAGILLSLNSFGQTGTIKGKIKTSDGVPAEYVNIGIKGTPQGGTTNNKGEYEIKKVIVGNYILVASFIGLETKEISIEVKANETTIVPEILLKENAQTLQEVVVQTGKNYTKEPLTAINRLDIKNIENPQSVQVINQELIKDKQIQTVGEAIKLMAGVNAFSSSQYSDYVMRGFRGGSGNLAYNGVRGDFYQFDQAALTYNIESIEAIKGPASVLFSAGNPGGVINHVTKRALVAPRYEILYTFGSFNQNRVMADATGAITKNKKLLYRMIVGYENTGQLDENLKIKNIFVAPQLHYDFTEKTSLNYEFNYANDNRTMGFNRGTPAQFNPTTNDWALAKFPNYKSLIDPNGTAIRNTMSHQVTFKHSFNDNVKFTTLYRGLTSKTFQADLSPGAWGIGATNDSIPLENRYWNEDLYNHQLSSFLNIKFTQEKFIKNNLVVGIDANVGGRTAEYAALGERIVSVLKPEFGWGFYNQNNVNNNLASASYQSGWSEKTTLLAGYFQNQMSIGNHVKLLLGGRFESHNYLIDYFDLITKAETSRDSLSATQFLPRAGIVYNPNESTAIYYGYSQSFVPQFGSNTGSGGPFPPEKSRQHEIGVKKEWLNQSLITTLSFYHIQKFDVLAPDPTDTNGVRLKQIANVYSKGVEFTAQGKITKGLDVIFNYSYNEARTPGDAGYDGFPAGWFPQAPNTNANLWAKYTLTDGKLKNLGFGAGFNYLSKRTTYTPGFEIPEFTTIDAAVSYKINKGLNLSSNIYNITNTKYWNGAYGPSNLWPGNPISFRFSVGYVF